MELKKIFISATVCVNDCNGKRDGDYQSCYTCGGFIKCSSIGLVNQSCSDSFPGQPLFWDDFKKECLYDSRTCNQTYIFN